MESFSVSLQKHTLFQHSCWIDTEVETCQVNALSTRVKEIPLSITVRTMLTILFACIIPPQYI